MSISNYLQQLRETMVVDQFDGIIQVIGVEADGQGCAVGLCGTG